MKSFIFAAVLLLASAIAMAQATKDYQLQRKGNEVLKAISILPGDVSGVQNIS